MACNKKILPFLLRDGSSQSNRLLPALNPDTLVRIDERSLRDLLTFAKEFAKNIKYFNFIKPDGTIEEFEDGTWFEFFDFDVAAIEKQLASRNDFDPYFVLYLAFLQLFQHAQGHLNQFTQKHLDFYYEEVLGLEHDNGKVDEVHVIFELVKNITEQFLEANTELDAGKDADGNKQTYKLLDDILVNDASISDIRSVYVEPPGNDVVHYATISNSNDGLGGKLNPDDFKWKAFGNKALPVKKVGFALASSILELREGTRIITAEINLSVGDIANSALEATHELELFFSGEKEWFGPFICNPALEPTGAGKIKLTIEYTLQKEDPALLPFTSVLTGKYNTAEPVMQVLFSQTTSNNLYGLLKNAKVDSAIITVDVKGISSLTMQNDQGNINAKKPFTPFGPIPVIGSSFYVGYDEIMRKKMDFTKFAFSFRVNWLDAPQKLHDHYKLYSKHSSITNFYFKADYILKGGETGNTNLFNADDARDEVIWPNHETDYIFFSLPGFGWSAAQQQVNFYSSPIALYNNPNYSAITYNFSPIQSQPVKQTGSQQLFFFPNIFTLSASNLDEEKGFIRFELKNEFFHKEFPGLYAVKMKEATSTDTLPNQPYTPTIKSIELDYKAMTHSVNFAETSFNTYQLREISLYYIGVFGEAEQHGFLKIAVLSEIHKTDDTRDIDTNIYLCPQYNNEGELLIGLAKAEPDQTLSILFQLAEGSSDPQKDVRIITWSVLCSNEWLNLKQTEILKDDTNHLLRSGIIKFVIPAYATQNNTILDAEKIWLRAKITEGVDAVCQFINLHTQAAKAIQDVAEDLPIASANTLAASTISKLINKVAAIKKVQQPYSSFNGKVAESDAQFYTRISERLRHKDRAVMAWDYEHIVLQHFPSVYKVKCLNHSSLSTSDTCCAESKPGYVTLVVVPDLKNKNAIQPLEPKVNRDTMSQIEVFLSEHSSLFLKKTIKVQNPEYEQVLLDFKVRFSVPGDFGFYQQLLNQALVEYLSPWAFDSSFEIQFGGKATKSVLINFIEEQGYVDFVTQVRLFHVVNQIPSADLDEIIVTNPRAILVSSEVHEIRKLEENEKCA